MIKRGKLLKKIYFMLILQHDLVECYLLPLQVGKITAERM